MTLKRMSRTTLLYEAVWGAEVKAQIFDIKRFAVHDGKGIRTTVFFKGCPLKCVWCHNPEGISFENQLAFFEEKCTMCMDCAEVCPTGAHSFKDGTHIIDREKCVSCGKCAKACLSSALRIYGRQMSVEEVMAVVLEDMDFYNSSGGGVTLSGGECLCQADFCAELLKRCKERGINTAVDTCGFIPRENIEKVLPYTDTFLYDIKAIDENVHINCTSRPNSVILENLRYIDDMGKDIEVRIPYVPEFNSGEIHAIYQTLKNFKNIKEIKVLPYHNFAGHKYRALCLENTLPEILPNEQEITAAENIFKGIGE